MRFSISGLLRAPLLLAVMAGAAHADTVTDTARRLEADLGGRVGVLLVERGAAPAVALRADERFPMASTFKVLLCGAVLSRIDAGQEQMHRVVRYGEKDLVPYAPVTEKHTADGMDIASLCEAAITLSDNTAANLLLDTVGGPEGLTAFLRRVGDAETRLDRRETALNEAAPGDPRDTTTPAAMLKTLDTLLFGPVLTAESRAQLQAWMVADKVADGLIRAHLPQGWKIGDKTGAGGHGTRGIVAVIQPPDGSAWLTAIYLTGNDADMAARNAALAEIGAAIIKEIAAP